METPNKDTIQKKFKSLQRKIAKERKGDYTYDERQKTIDEYNKLVPLFNSYNKSIGKPANATKISIKKAMTGKSITKPPKAHSGTKKVGAMGHKTVKTPKPKVLPKIKKQPGKHRVRPADYKDVY